MNRPVDETLEATQPTTVLDRVRPTVVVRRRIYQPAPRERAHERHEREDDERGPPSSVNVARAIASLRSDELHRLEKILEGNDERVGAEVAHAGAEAAQAADAEAAHAGMPRVRVGPTIAVTELARRMNVSVQELMTTLVTRGFFSVTVKTFLPRETARAATTHYGWQIEETDESEPPKAKAKKAKKAKARPKLEAKTATKASKPSKPSKPSKASKIKVNTATKAKTVAPPKTRASTKLARPTKKKKTKKKKRARSRG